jgi:hypothetical protein
MRRLNYEFIIVWAVVIIACLAFWYGLFAILT